MAVLPTNYLDDILAASMGGKRRFRITHEDGSTEEVTLEDVSEYEQVGSPFGSGDVNKTNQTVNEKLDSADVVDPALATVLGFAADAKLTGDALSELNKNLTNFIISKGKIPRGGSVTIEFDQIPVGCIISHGTWTNQSLDFIAFNYDGSIEITTLGKFGNSIVNISRNGNNLILTNTNFDYQMPYGVYLFGGM